MKVLPEGAGSVAGVVEAGSGSVSRTGSPLPSAWEVAALRSGSEAYTAGAYARPAPSCSLLERSMPRATTAFTGA